ncbi:MAG: imidazole glycerol phosphate synthase subunit HisH [Elusimicrobiota bacterium]
MIAIIDYGVGNLRSIAKAFENLGEKTVFARGGKDILDADAVVLPGVGAFKPAVSLIIRNKLVRPLKEFAASGRPMLGICLGMQLFFSESAEGGKSKGLNLIPGYVRKLPVKKLPQIGWNRVTKSGNGPSAKKSNILAGIPDNSYFYFVHSYFCAPADKRIVAATTRYGINYPSIVQKGNVIGTQFHPEKSSLNGLRLLKNFCDTVTAK